MILNRVCVLVVLFSVLVIFRPVSAGLAADQSDDVNRLHSLGQGLDVRTLEMPYAAARTDSIHFQIGCGAR